MSERDFNRRPARQIAQEGREARLRVFARFDRCPECNAFPGAPCRDRGWGGGVREHPHPARPERGVE